jgi:hypothetical protein
MDTYVESLGFVVAAIVFSIGLLSARIHDSFNALLRQTVELSWTMRVRLIERQRVSPADIDELTSALSDAADPVAGASLTLNRLLLVVSGVIFALAITAKTAPADPPHSDLLLTLLFGTCVSVVLLGEYDWCLVARRRRRLMESATLGRIRSLGDALSERDSKAVAARLARLRSDFPRWGLLCELDALLDIYAGALDRALATIGELVAEPEPDLYLSQLIAVEAATSQLDDAAGHQLLAEIARAEPTLPYVAELFHAFELRLAHLDALVDATQTDAPDRAGELSWAQQMAGAAAEEHGYRSTSGLDLRPHSLPGVSHLVSIIAFWNDATRPPDHSTAPRPSALRVVLDQAFGPSVSATETANRRWGAGTLETFGVVAMAHGRPRDGLQLLERAAREDPTAARTQWWIAIACRHLNWQTAAAKALDRSETLDPDDPLIDATRSWLSAADATAVSAEITVVTEMDTLRAAFLGCAPATAQRASPTSLHQRFVTKLCTGGLALAANRDKGARNA